MAQAGFVLPLNDVVQGMYLTERLAVGANADPAKMLPGMHVVFDVNDYEVKQGGAAGLVIGIIGYGEANADYKPETRDTSYAVGDEIPIHNGTFRARVHVSGDVVKGQGLVALADGKFGLAVAATVKVTGGATINTDGVVNGSSGAQGPILGRVAVSRTGAGYTWAVMSI